MTEKELIREEADFIKEIDCAFPYLQATRAKELIQVGARISPNAAFMVLHELCRNPRGVKVRPFQLQKYIEYWSESFSHPLNKLIVPVAIKMVHHKRIPVDRCLAYMDQVSLFKDCINVLDILYFSCESHTGPIETKYVKILQQWQKA